MEQQLEPLSEKDRIKIIVNILESGTYSLAITLISGETLFGDPTLDFSFQYGPYSGKIKEESFSDWRARFVQPIGDYVDLLFPDGAGTVHGHSFCVQIPNNVIANIQGIEPFIKNGPERALRNSPNPLSIEIMEHNMDIIKRLNLKRRDYMEMALSKKAISGDGIVFNDFQLLYSNWEYFRVKSGGINSIGFSSIIGGSIGYQKSLYSILIKKLTSEKFFRVLLDKNPDFNTEIRLRGIISKDPDSQDTVLEGKKWLVFGFKVSTGNIESAFQFLPILLKDEAFLYPKEYINEVRSELTIYGSLQQIPIRLNNESYPFSIVIQGMAYIPE